MWSKKKGIWDAKNFMIGYYICIMISSIKTKKLLVLIDGSSYFHRAYHALPKLKNARGEPTGAIYGVINMIRKLIADYNPTYIAVVFDAKGKNFRHEMYPQYKATRPPMEDELISQVEPLREIIQAMGMPLLVIEGIEADDVIGTLAKEATEAGIDTLVSTGDKDLAQVVNQHISLINTMNNTVLNNETVKEKFGVTPEQIIDYLTLIGDTSDNVPGVPMIGPKTAVKLLNEYGSLDKIIEHKDEIKGKVGENLRASLEQIPLAKKLVTIKKDVILPVTINDLEPKKPDNEKLKEFFVRFEFKNWLKSINAENPQIFEENKFAENSNYKIIFNENDLQNLLNQLQNTTQFAFELETTSLDIINAEIVGLAFAIKVDEAFYLPVAHDYLGAPTQLNRESVLEQLKPIFENSTINKFGQNLKYDLNVLANYKIDLQGINFDAMLASYVLNSSSNLHNKEAIAMRYLGKAIITYEDVAGKGAKQIAFNQVAIEKAAKYAAGSVDIVLQLHDALLTELAHFPNLQKVFTKIEMPLLIVLARMERTGVCIDANLLKQQSEIITVKLKQLENEAYLIAGEMFNLNSPQQLQEILFTKLKLPMVHKTPKGQPSTGEATLQELSVDFPLPKIILEYRGLNKLKTTYLDALPQEINPKTGRVHTSYNQAVTTTGRLSSTNPNLQNIPIRTEEGRKIRQAFVADPGFKIVSADYSQIELRIMAHLSQDENLCKAFADDLDVHRATAAEILGIPLEQVTNEQRQRAKAINFGLIYGMSAFGLAKRVGLSREDAQSYISAYFTRYPKVKNYMDLAKSRALELGYVETIFGRRLYMPDLQSRNYMARAAAERAAINAPMQGSAADIMKIAMINVDHWIQSENIPAKMIMQVHDELVFEIPENLIKEISFKIKDLMENVVKLQVPIMVNVGVGNNWDEAH